MNDERREYIAAAVYAALIVQRGEFPPPPASQVARQALYFADVLIAEMDKERSR